MSLTACVGIPDDIKAVEDFEVQRYLGKWYEIARLDHSFERGLNKVSAEYHLKENGDIKVINRGYNAEKERWQEAEGNAKFVEDSQTGRLKVSFFGPFYGAYNIIALDKNHYQYAMIIGNNREYLWILARQPTLEEKTLNTLVEQAKTLGFAVDELIYVSH
ncbi:MAG: lipocalin family protein [bacterium]